MPRQDRIVVVLPSAVLGRTVATLFLSILTACGDGTPTNLGSASCLRWMAALQACGLRGEGLGFCYSNDSPLGACHADCAERMSCEELNSCDEPACFRECWEQSFDCEDGSRLYLTAVCDGTAHCPNGEDERGCREVEFRCGDGSGPVLSGSVVCDGNRDCEDGSDEVCARKLVPCSNPAASAEAEQP